MVAMQKWMRQILRANRAEFKRALLLFIYFFLAMASYYTMKPVRSSLFLSELGPKKLPFVYMGSVGITFFSVYFYAALTRWVSRHTLILVTSGFFFMNLLVFWWLFTFRPFPQLAAIFYVWVTNFNLILVTQFWSLTNDLHNPREGKRLFGFIGAGGILGSVLTGFVVAGLVKKIGTENLLLMSALLLLLMLIPAYRVCRLEQRKLEEKKEEAEEADRWEETPDNGLMLIFKSYYLILIASIVVVTNVVATIIDYQFQTVISSRFDKDAMTAFLGVFFSAITISAFVFQILFTSRFHQKLGITFSLLIQPVAILLTGGAFVIHKVWSTATALKFLDGTLGYSIQQTSKELLYLPTSHGVKYRAKAFIDVFFYRFGDALASIMILLFAAYHLPLRSLTGLTMAACIVWILLVFLTKIRYLECLREIIKRRVSYPKQDIEQAMAKLAPELKKQAYEHKNPLAITKQIMEEARNYFLCLHLSFQLESRKDEKLKRMATQVKEERLRLAKRIFRLIGFIQPSVGLYDAFHYLIAKESEHDAMALELLDNILSRKIRKRVLPLFNFEDSMEERLASGQRYWKTSVQELKSYLKKITKDSTQEDALGSLELCLP
jgi:AAA family ATP:ADP antiporter